MKKVEIAEKHGVAPGFITALVRKDKFTTIIPLAIDLAKLTGENPIEYITNRKGFREYALVHFPVLKKFHKNRVTRKA